MAASNGGVAPAKPLSQNVVTLQKRAKRLADDAEQKKLEAGQAVAEAQQLPSTLLRLHKEHDDAAYQLAHADDQFAEFHSAILSVENRYCVQ